MAHLPVLDNVFPFVCSNQECNHVYDLEDFIHVALLWGFICLESKEHQLIGLTCPNCPRPELKQTTLRKYRLRTKDFSIKILGIAAKNFIPGVNEEDLQFNHYIPFSKKILYWYFSRPETAVPHIHLEYFPKFPGVERVEQEFFPEQFQNRKLKGFVKREEFKIPHGIHLFDHQYPDIATKDFPKSFTEDYLIHSCDVERDHRYKTLPRIVSHHSIYKYSDVLFREKPNSNFLSNKEINNLVEAFEHMVHFKNISRYNQLVLENGIDLSQYVSLFRQILETLQLENSREKIDEFFKGYARVRNLIDFNLYYRDKFERNFIQELGQIKKQAESHYQFFQEGSTWTIVFSGIKTPSLKGKGFKYIHYLISNPNREFKTVELDADERIGIIESGSFNEETIEKEDTNTHKKKVAKDSQDKIDDEALANYKKRLQELNNERIHADEDGDSFLIIDIDQEYNWLESQIKKYVGLHGKKKRFESDQSKIKNRITKSIERALNDLKDKNSHAYEHLFKALKPINSYTLSYRPTQAIDWKLTPN